MFLKGTKQHIKPVPAECEGLEIKVQSSTCTGERTIGFYDRKNRCLLYSELVKSDADIEQFYRKYGLERK